MLNPEQVKPFLFHPEKVVREQATRYFEESCSRDPELMPLVLRSCQMYGENENSLVLALASRFKQSETTLRAVLECLPWVVGEDVNAYWHYSLIMANADPTLLARLMPDLRENQYLRPEIVQRIEQRLDVVTWDSERLWADLSAFCRAGAGKYVNEIDFGYGLTLVESITRNEDTPAEAVLTRLRETPAGYAEIYLVVLAGLMALEDAVPVLIAKMRTGSDLCQKEVGEALVRIGTDEVVRQLQDCFSNEDWDFRLSASSVFGRIKSPAAEQALLEVIPKEPDLTVKTNLADGLCRLMSERGLHLVRETIRDGYDSGLLDLDESLYTTSVILGLERVVPRLVEASGASSLFLPPKPPIPASSRKIGRNAPCPCGSGKKFKKCCLGKETPSVISDYQRLDDLMQDGYRLFGIGEVARACAVWLEAWEAVKSLLGFRVESIGEADIIFPGQQFLANWCQDLEMELGNLATEDGAFYRKRIDYCREFCMLFPRTNELTIQNMKRAEAESYFGLGLPDQGEIAFRALIREFPRDAWGYIGWGDMYWLYRREQVSPDYDKAESIYLMALANGMDDAGDVQERLDDLRKEREGRS